MAKNRTAHPHHGAAFFNGQGPIAAHPHAQDSPCCPSRFRDFREGGLDLFVERGEGRKFSSYLRSVVGEGGHAHQAHRAEVGVAVPCLGRCERLQFLRVKPKLRGFLGNVDLKQKVDLSFT